MFHQTFPLEISFILKIKVHNLPHSKKFRNSQKLPRTMSACPRLFAYLAIKLRNIPVLYTQVDCQTILSYTYKITRLMKVSIMQRGIMARFISSLISSGFNGNYLLFVTLHFIFFLIYINLLLNKNIFSSKSTILSTNLFSRSLI